jgi:very-short-patch-repair endonuclease
VSSKLEELLALHIEAKGLPAPEREWTFAKPRRWRLDFAWPDRQIGCEVEGGVYINGRHNRGAGFEADLEKYATAEILGWRVLRVGPSMVKSGRAVELLEMMLNGNDNV